MKKQALLIGINNYSGNGSLNNLNFARQDAEEVCDALKAYYGFTEDEITLMTCEQKGTLSPTTRDNILNQLPSETFKEPLDLFIFGFWGHGIWEDNVRYLCPMSTLQNKLSNTCLPLNEVVQCIAKQPIHNACFILDCCQNIAGRGALYMQEEEKKYLENLPRDIVYVDAPHNEETFNRNVAILNACRPGEIAYEWDKKKHGIFTAHLLDAMRKRLNTVNEWALYLADKVNPTAKQLGKRSQTPLCSMEGRIELPDAPESGGELPTPHVTIHGVAPLEEVMKQATLRLVELFQDSIRIHENEEAKKWFLRQKEEILSVYMAIENRSITGQAAYSRLLEIAKNAGKWINANRSALGRKKLVYASYLWYSWKAFASKNNLEDISNALNP